MALNNNAKQYKNNKKYIVINIILSDHVILTSNIILFLVN